MEFSDLGIYLPANARTQVKTQCPQCGQPGLRTNWRDKSLSVNTEDGIFLCHYCGWKGRVKDGPPRVKPTKVWKKPEPLQSTGIPCSTQAQSFFTKRKISDEVVDRYHVTEENGGLKFPYTRDGELVNIKTRLPNKKFHLEEGCELIFFGIDQLQGAEQIAIVEGEMDVLAMATAGVPAISVPNGASIGSMAYMESAESIFDACHTIIIAVDNDGPGIALEAELARRIGKSRCARTRWPEGCKDANDVLMTHGPDVLREFVARAEDYPVEGANWLEELTGDAMALRQQEQKRGASTGWRNVDALYTVMPGELTVVTGYPGSGKSEWLDAMMINLAQYEGWTFAVYSPENQGVDHFIKLAEKYLSKPYWDGPTPPMTDDDIRSFTDWGGKKFLMLSPEFPTLDTLLGIARGFVLRHGIRGLVIDPFNRMDHARSGGQNMTEHINVFLGKLSSFARYNDVHVWLIAHPKKPERINGTIPIPTPFDIAESAHFFNMAENCITVYRDKTNDNAPVQIHVQKIRLKRVGRLGQANLAYDVVTGRYREVVQ